MLRLKFRGTHTIRLLIISTGWLKVWTATKWLVRRRSRRFYGSRITAERARRYGDCFPVPAGARSARRGSISLPRWRTSDEETGRLEVISQKVEREWYPDVLLWASGYFFYSSRFGHTLTGLFLYRLFVSAVMIYFPGASILLQLVLENSLRTCVPFLL